MEWIYKYYLFDKHILVNDEAEVSTEDQFETLFSLANLFNIRIVKGEKLVSKDMIRVASMKLGVNVPEPFYRGFPQTVRELTTDQLIFDQLLSYVKTYGIGNFSEATHSIFEKQFERAAFQEKTTIKEFTVIDEKEAEATLAEYVNNLLAGTRPLSNEQYNLVSNYIVAYKFTPSNVASKNTAMKLLMDTKNLEFTSYLYMSDVIKMVDELNYKYYGNTNMKKLNLRNQDRKFIISVIEKIFESGRVDIRDCYEKKKLWNGLLHHVHYKAKSAEAQQFLDAMRGGENHSVYSEFEKAMAEKQIMQALEILRSGKGSGAVLRNLNYIMSRCESIEDLERVINSLDTKNVIILIQLLIQYSQYKTAAQARTFIFTKYNMMKAHTETDEEQKKRKSVISEGQVNMMVNKLTEILTNLLKNRLGKVYIDPDMVNYALPIQENTSMGGFGVLAKGTKIKLPETKKLRAFTYWEKVDDIDLSVFGISDDGKRTEFSWRTMAGLQSPAIKYSGDETSGYNGGSEYFDIDMEKMRKQYPDIHYMIFCNNVFSGVPFARCYCKAGYMTRDLKDSGKIYEPKTVQSSFFVDCESTFAYLFGLDLKSNEFVWLNVGRSGDFTVAGNSSMNFLTEYFHVTEVINVYTFFEMMATEVVDNMLDADIVVTNKDVHFDENDEAAKKIEVIREYDFEKMIKLMNQ